MILSVQQDDKECMKTILNGMCQEDKIEGL